MGGKRKKVIVELPGDRLAFVSPGKAKQIESFKKYARRNAKKKGITLPEEENKGK